MSSSGAIGSIVLGRVFHTDEKKAEQQRVRSQTLTEALVSVGFAVRDEVAFDQEPFASPSTLSPHHYLRAARTFWSQQLHHLRESRRRRGHSSRIPWGKRRKAALELRNLLLNRDKAMKAVDRGFIEEALAHKHIKLWRSLVESDALGAVIVEDDFSFRRRDSPARVAEIVSRLSGQRDLIDLAGGFSRDQLGLSRLGNGDLTVEYLLANTTCGYFISRRAAEALVELVRCKPDLVRLGSDFLIEALNSKGFQATTFLPAELPLVHGSIEGVVPSSIPY